MIHLPAWLHTLANHTDRLLLVKRNLEFKRASTGVRRDEITDCDKLFRRVVGIAEVLESATEPARWFSERLGHLDDVLIVVTFFDFYPGIFAFSSLGIEVTNGELAETNARY